jgi:peptide/nickel transport system permease protein
VRRYLAGRLLQTATVLLGLSLLVFALLVWTPGDPVELLATANPEVTPADVQRLRQYYGLDDPLLVRYLKWLRAVSRGDLGYSRTYGIPVRDLLVQRLRNTLLLAGTAFLLALAGGTAAGVYSALRQYSPADYGITVLSFVGLAIPNFWQGILSILVFAVWLPLFPPGGMATPGVVSGWPALLDRLWHLVLPVSVLATSGAAAWARYVRSSLLEVIHQDYVRTARAKGLSEARVIGQHALRNALLPVITLVALAIPGVVNGAVLTETVFSWPGMGLLLYQAVLGHDFNVAMAVLLLLAVVTVAANLLADVAYALVDPRVRYG